MGADRGARDSTVHRDRAARDRGGVVMPAKQRATRSVTRDAAPRSRKPATATVIDPETPSASTPEAPSGKRRAVTKDLRTLTVQEAMARTGFPRDVLYDLVASGQLQHVRPPRRGGTKGRIRILEASLESFFEEQLAAQGQKRRLPVERPVLDADDELDRELPLDGPRVFS